MGIVMLAASGIVVAASFATQRRSVPLVLLACAVSVSVAILITSGIALRLANAFRLRWVSGLFWKPRCALPFARGYCSLQACDVCVLEDRSHPLPP